MEKIILMNPYDEKQQSQIIQYEQETSIGPLISSRIDQITNSYTEEELQNYKKNSNAVEEFIIIEENKKIKGICQIQGEKDRKSCQISIIGNKEQIKDKKLLILATEYAINNMGMIEVFLMIDKNDKDMEKYLTLKGFENLGEENGKALFLKEKYEDKRNKESYYETAR